MSRLPTHLDVIIIYFAVASYYPNRNIIFFRNPVSCLSAIIGELILIACNFINRLFTDQPTAFFQLFHQAVRIIILTVRFHGHLHISLSLRNKGPHESLVGTADNRDFAAALIHFGATQIFLDEHLAPGDHFSFGTDLHISTEFSRLQERQQAENNRSYNGQGNNQGSLFQAHIVAPP